jgi:hypothetical protein
MAEGHNDNDPMNFVRGMWGNMGFKLPGMIAPTLDTDDLGKQIADLKAVEGWLRMNLSMLQMTIQNLEMQQTTLSAVKAMGQMAQEANESGATGEAAAQLSQAAMWPWTMMQQVQEQMLKQGAGAAPSATDAAVRKSAGEGEAPRTAKRPRKQ